MSEHGFHGRILFPDPGGWDESVHRADTPRPMATAGS